MKPRLTIKTCLLKCLSAQYSSVLFSCPFEAIIDGILLIYNFSIMLGSKLPHLLLGRIILEKVYFECEGIVKSFLP